MIQDNLRPLCFDRECTWPDCQDFYDRCDKAAQRRCMTPEEERLMRERLFSQEAAVLRHADETRGDFYDAVDRFVEGEDAARGPEAGREDG